MTLSNLNSLAGLLATDRDKKRGTGPLWATLSAGSARAVNQTMRLLQRTRPETFGVFASEEELFVAIVDAFDSDPPQASSLDELAETLEGEAKQRWRVAAPLINVLPPLEPETVAHDTIFVATQDAQKPTPALRRFATHEVDPGHARQQDPDDILVHTRHTASLISTETGTRRTAESRALCRAQYVLAVWVLLRRPENEMMVPLWPTASTWLPQPSMHIESSPVRIDDGARQNDAMLLYPADESGLYEPPKGSLRAAPFRALAAIERRPATALLSAAWSLYLAARVPTDLHCLDRIELVMRGREALCERPPEDSSAGNAIERWRAISGKLDVASELRQLGFDATDYKSVTKRAWELRNLSAHSAEEALLSIGYPTSRSRLQPKSKPIPGTELAPLHIRDALEPTFAAVGFVARELWRRMLATDFDEDAWEACFVDSQ